MKRLLLALVLWFAASGAALAVVNINTATKEELTTLKGVGDKRAQEIIDYRKKNGNFKSIDELEKVPWDRPRAYEANPLRCYCHGKDVHRQARGKGR